MHKQARTLALRPRSTSVLACADQLPRALDLFRELENHFRGTWNNVRTICWFDGLMELRHFVAPPDSTAFFSRSPTMRHSSLVIASLGLRADLG